MLFSPKIRTIFTLAVILAVTFVSYLPVLKGEFLLWDDDVHLVDNITVRGLDLEHVQEMFTSTVNKIYIPLTSLSFALEYHFWGYQPFVYHLDNVLLHLCVVALAFFLGQKMGLSQTAAGVAALVFGIHPIHVESVAWITERKDVLYAAFYLAALLSYVRYLEWKRGLWLWMTTVLGILSMLAKPMALSLPLILLLLDWFKGRPLKSRAFLEKLPLFILIAGIGGITYAAHARVPGESVVRSILIWPWTFTFYLRQFLFPFISLPLYRLPHPITLANPHYFLSAVVLAAVIGAVARFRRHKWFVFAVLFYFFSIFFLLRFDEARDTNIVADRFMYLPSLGFCLLIGLVFQSGRTRARKIRRWALTGGLIVLSAIFSFRTFQQSRVWQNSLTLWQHQLKYFPDERIALNNLATALGKKEEFKAAEKEYRRIMKLTLEQVQQGLSPRAVESVRRIDYLIGLYLKAIKADPDFEDARYNLGNLYAAIGRFPEAVEAYKEALRIDPKFKDAHAGLGDLYVEIGDAAQAIYAYGQALQLNPDNEDVYIHIVKAYTEALEKNPDHPVYREARKDALARYAALVNKNRPRATSYFNLGNIYAQTGDAPMALLAYRRALELNPRHAATLYNLGNLYKDQGRFRDALAFYQKALDIDGRLSDAWLNKGVIHGKMGDRALEKSCYQKAAAADPKNGRAYFNLGFLEESAGNLKNAVEFYQKSVSLDPANAEGYYNLGNMYAKIDNPAAAIESYLKAVEQNPQHMNALVNLSILSFQQKDFAAAVKYFDEAVLAGYDAPEGYRNALAPYRSK